jgi:hypothetical protein
MSDELSKEILEELKKLNEKIDQLQTSKRVVDANEVCCHIVGVRGNWSYDYNFNISVV